MTENIIYRLCCFDEAQKIHDLTNEVMEDLKEKDLLDFYGGVSKTSAESSMRGDSVIIGAFASDNNTLLGYLLCEFVNDEITRRYAKAFSISDEEVMTIAILNGMAVKPSYQNSHIGFQMLQYANRWAARRGVKYLMGIVHPNHPIGFLMLDHYNAIYSEIFLHKISRGNIPRRRFCIKV